jgi:Uma2 family endonuclease
MTILVADDLPTLPQAGRSDQRLLMPGISWQRYGCWLDHVGDESGLRLLYLDGVLEIFMPSPEHELIKKAIARLLERYAEEVEIALHAYGSTTFRQSSKAAGLEPDECYCIGTLKPQPDLAVEVNLTSGGLDKLAIYRAIGVPEVLIWQDQQLTLYNLRGDEIQIADRSEFFPALEIAQLAQFIQPQNQPTAIKAFVNWVRSGAEHPGAN